MEIERILGPAFLFLVGLALLVHWLRRRDRSPARATAQADRPSPRSVEELIAAGRKIDAIKLYRREQGVGLREAKEAVESLAQGLPE